MLKRTTVCALVAALPAWACVATLYAHRTIEGAPFPFAQLPAVREGMPAGEVRALLGAPLQTTDAQAASTWRYFERANPRWCDGDSSRSKRPEYSIEAILVFSGGVLVNKSVNQSGTPASP
jgi:outer membrane protein assembly factor BamE (lipoprotein component of BamABCDE complex)